VVEDAVQPAAQLDRKPVERRSHRPEEPLVELAELLPRSTETVGGDPEADKFEHRPGDAEGKRDIHASHGRLWVKRRGYRVDLKQTVIAVATKRWKVGCVDLGEVKQAEPFSATTAVEGDAVTVVVVGEVDLVTAPKMYGAAIRHPATSVTLDLRGVSFFDSAGVHAMVSSSTDLATASRCCRPIGSAGSWS
jgi:ABC-type transporter Mla MlaB component